MFVDGLGWQWIARSSLLGRGPVLRYGVAIVTFAAALLLRFQVGPALPPGFPFLTFFPAVILTAFVAGLGPGVLAAVLCGLAAWYCFIPPYFAFASDASNTLAMGFYTLIVAVDVAVIHGMQTAMAQLHEERSRTATLLAARTTMFHELQHRVANNMQFVAVLLEMQRLSIGNTPEGAALALEEAGRRLETMARVHRRLHDPQSSDDFGRHLEALCRDMLTAAGARNIVCHVTVEAAPRSPERLLALALLVVEALTNSLKHAFAGRDGGTVTITLRTAPEQPDHLHLRMTDDGVGLPQGFDADRLPSLGWKIIQSLTEQLSGQLSYGAGNGAGTRIDLRFPA